LPVYYFIILIQRRRGLRISPSQRNEAERVPRLGKDQELERL
jgi:hypothetical protein